MPVRFMADFFQTGALATLHRLGPTPLALTLIKHSRTTVIATQHQTIGGVGYDFVGWSDGGAAIHDITPDASGTLIATFAPSTP